MPEKSFLDRAAESSLRNGNALEAIPRNSTFPLKLLRFCTRCRAHGQPGTPIFVRRWLAFCNPTLRSRMGAGESVPRKNESSGLPSARVELSAVRELTIRPFAALGGNGRCCRGRVSFRIPIRRSRMNPPDIARFVECQAHYPALASHSQGHTVGDASRNTFATGELVEAHGLSGLERTRNPYAATLRIYHEGVARLGEWGFSIHAGNTKRNLGADSSAGSSCFCRFFCRVHSEKFPIILLSKWGFGYGILH
jgi:hypothetical protein